MSLRVRALAGPKDSLIMCDEVFRLLAAGVPRATRKAFSFLVAPDSAEDFDVAFQIPDHTDDLVLQIRVGDTVARRRLSQR